MSKEQYLKHMEENLKKKQRSLKLELEDVFELTFSPEVDIVDFILLDTVNGTDIMIYCMNLEGEEVYSGYGECCFAGSEKVMENTGIFKVDEELDLESIYSDHPEVEHDELELISNWFLEAFEQAGGREFKLPCYFGIEHDIKSLDLKRNKWVLNGSEKFS